MTSVPADFSPAAGLCLSIVYELRFCERQTRPMSRTMKHSTNFLAGHF
jgi:hypothetical protein